MIIFIVIVIIMVIIINPQSVNDMIYFHSLIH